MALVAAVDLAESVWVQIVKSILLILIALQLLPVIIVGERKLLGRFQNRLGPNRVGPRGFFQPLADIVKLASKEPFRPMTAAPALYLLAPALSVAGAILAFAVVPLGNVVSISGVEVGLYGIDVGVAPLYLFACGAIGFYGLMLGGWSSGSKYSFLGSMRAAAQLISYEVAQGLALLGVIFMTGSLSLIDMVERQDPVWFVVPQLVGFLIFFVSGFAETNRPPFDLPEADAELVQGYMTEYGGGAMTSFLFAEYLNMLTVSAITVTVFLGGWHLPFVDTPAWTFPFIVLGKTLVLVFFFFWVRATLPRLRYDQLMSFGWKVLLPLATLNALVTAILVVVIE
jgi:NADH-quinone oxidoreductase subunit H